MGWLKKGVAKVLLARKSEERNLKKIKQKERNDQKVTDLIRSKNLDGFVLSQVFKQWNQAKTKNRKFREQDGQGAFQNSHKQCLI